MVKGPPHLSVYQLQGLRNDFQDAMEQIDQDYLDDLARQVGGNSISAG